MTYPPQPPGQSGWGQQQPHNAPAQPVQAQQQPAWYGNQHTGLSQGQHPGAPQQPGHGQQQPAPPDWGGGQPAPWVLDPNGFEMVVPQQKKSKLPWVLGGLGAVLLLGGGGVGLFLWLSSGPGDPKTVAHDVIDNVNAGEFSQVKSHLCEANESELESQLNILKNGEFQLRVGQVSQNGDKATVQLTGTYSMGGTSDSVDQSMVLADEGGSWKVCQFGQ